MRNFARISALFRIPFESDRTERPEPLGLESRALSTRHLSPRPAMTEIDWIILALLFLSTIVGVVRGVVRETLAVAGWIVGILLALNFSAELADRIPLESLGTIPRVLIAGTGIVVAVLFAFGLLGTLMRKMLEVAEVTFEDRVLGAVFGLTRGIVAVCAAVFVFGMIDDVRASRMWRQSILIAPAETLR